MAFQQPQRAQPRPRSFSAELSEPIITTTTASTTANAAQQQQQPRQSPRQDPHDWIVFSPAAPSDTYDRTDSTIRTDHVAGEVSEFGSLDTAAISEKPKQHARLSFSPKLGDAEAQEDDQDLTESEDADSLDDGLHAFNEPSLDSDQRAFVNRNDSTVLLPTHDGMGIFPGNSSPVQEQFWQHEKYNPKRRRQSLRMSSLQKRFEALEEQVPQMSEEDKIQRIEKWRNEQSQAILAEIERETRRRRRRKSRTSTNRSTKPASSITTEMTASHRTSTTPATSQSATPHEQLSFWERITRSVIRNLMGIDDATFEFIFGESSSSDSRSTEKPSPASELVDHAERAIPNDGTSNASTESWEQRLLSRIAKELGVLLGHISEHPGAFTSYLNTQEPLAYAGISASDQASSARTAKTEIPSASRPFNSSTASAKFAPTLVSQPHHRPHYHSHHRHHSLNTTDPSLWGIEEEDEELSANIAAKPTSLANEAAQAQREREYWERDLDVKMVFGFLRDRFSSNPSTVSYSPQGQQKPNEANAYAAAQSSNQRQKPSLQVNTTSTFSTLPTYSTSNANSLRRAALIRHHHPLVSRNFAASTQTSQPPNRSRVFSSANPVSPILGRRPSRAADTESCASQSTKRSKTAHSGSLSSRNYWDIGGSGAGGGSLGGPTLGWGEVL